MSKQDRNRGLADHLKRKREEARKVKDLQLAFDKSNEMLQNVILGHDQDVESGLRQIRDLIANGFEK